MTNTEKMFALIDEYKGSNLSMRAFAESKGIKLSTFGYWVRKQKQSEQAGGFIPIQAVNAPANTSVEILYPNGVRLIAHTRDLSYLHRLVKFY